MTCTRLPSPPGTTVIVCHKGARGRRCDVCGRAQGVRLCDGVVFARGVRRVCSASLCAGCAVVGGPEVDWCPRCAAGRPEGSGAVVVFTARVSYRRADALDVTAKSATDDGLAFAPTWRLVAPVIAARRHLDALREQGAAGESIENAEGALEAMWPLYVDAFRDQMRESHGRPRTAPWRRLLARRCVTLTCYCTDPARCHRTLLARDMLPRCGAVYGGEREVPSMHGRAVA